MTEGALSWRSDKTNRDARTAPRGGARQERCSFFVTYFGWVYLRMAQAQGTFPARVFLQHDCRSWTLHTGAGPALRDPAALHARSLWARAVGPTLQRERRPCIPRCVENLVAILPPAEIFRLRSQRSVLNFFLGSYCNAAVALGALADAPPAHVIQMPLPPAAGIFQLHVLANILFPADRPAP